MPPFSALAAGSVFASFINSKFGKAVSVLPPSKEEFSLLVAFGRCRFRLDVPFVAGTLCMLFGSSSDSFKVGLVQDRIFLFNVSYKAVGFEIYKIRELSCDEFKLSFHLFNDAGL